MRMRRIITGVSIAAAGIGIALMGASTASAVTAPHNPCTVTPGSSVCTFGKVATDLEVNKTDKSVDLTVTLPHRTIEFSNTLGDHQPPKLTVTKDTSTTP